MPSRLAGLATGLEPEMEGEANGPRRSDPANHSDSPASSKMTDDEHNKFLVSLRSVMTAFVDLGFGVHAVQQAVTRVGKDEFARLAEDFLQETVQSNEPVERS